MKNNVVPFPGTTTVDLNPDIVVKEALGKLDNVVVLGIDKEGNEYFAASDGDGGTVLWLLERCKKMLLELADD